MLVIFLQKYITLSRTMLILILTVIILGCSDSNISHIAIDENYRRAETANLHITEAQLRSASISNISYEINLDLTQDQKYSGIVEIRFDYSPTPYPVTLDFKAGEVERIWINNGISAINYNGNFVTIEATDLREGGNRLKLQFSSQFANNDNGLNKYIDPNDKHIYMFTKSELFESNRLFPSFDQIDLKASYISRIIVRKDWQVITSTAPVKVDDKGDFKLWFFEDNSLINQSQYSIFAGDWHSWRGKAQNTDIEVLIRKSLKEKIPIRNWFANIQQGITAINKSLPNGFDSQKMHLILTPGIYNNQDSFKNTYALSEDTLIDNKHLNQMWKWALINHWSSQFFVNAQWSQRWYRPWLESRIFNRLFKTDLKLSSSNRIGLFAQPNLALISESTHSADPQHRNYWLKNNKAVHLLNGLLQFIPESEVNLAVVGYFTNNGTNFSDLLNELDPYSRVNLADWSNQWLLNSGVNQLHGFIQCESGKINQLELRQIVSAKIPLIRALNIKVFSNSAEQPIEFELNMSSEKKFSDNLNGLPCDTAVYLQPEPYIKASSNSSISALLKLAKANPDLDVLALLNSNPSALEDLSTYTAKFWLDEIIRQIVVSQQPVSQDIINLIKTLSGLIGANSNEQLSRLTQVIQQRSTSLDKGTDLRIHWFQSYIQLAESKSDLDHLFTWIAGYSEPKDLLKVGHLKIQTLAKLIEAKHSKIDLLIEHFTASDSQFSKGWLVAAKTQTADKAHKVNYITELLKNNNATPSSYMPVLLSMFKKDQKLITNEVLISVMPELPKLEQLIGDELFQFWLQPVITELCSVEVNTKLALYSEQFSTLGQQWLEQLNHTGNQCDGKQLK